MVNYNLSYNRDFCGVTIRTQNVYTMHGILNRFVASSTGQNFTCTLSGFYFSGQSGLWMQTTDSEWVLNTESEFIGQSTYQITIEDAQKIIDTITANDKRIYENNLICARFADRLTDEQRNQLTLLQGRLSLRDTAIRLNTNLRDKKESYPQGYIEFYDRLQQITGGVGIVISTTAMIIISAVVLAGMATAVYFAFRSWCNESIRDVKYSDELTKTLLEKLTPEEYARLKKETGGMITKAKLSGRFAGASGLFKWVLIGVGCGFLYNSYKKRKQKGGIF